ncbi:MAG: lytic transglycosylase domain-containing protein [Candidatus Binataceae bacterium]
MDERALFAAVGGLYAMDPGLLEAIATAESGNHAAAVSGKGAMGLMQLMPATALRFDVADPFDPVESALGAARFLAYLRRHACRDLPELLAAYNAGEGAVKRHHGIPPYPETREYVRRVLWLYLLGSGPVDAGDPPQPGPAHAARAGREASHASADGDEAVLDQLTQLQHQRVVAAQTR